jgi:hypothetical protein
MNVRSVYVKTPLFWSQFNETDFLDRLSKNPQVPNLMKIRQVIAEMFHANGRTDIDT